MEHGSKVTDTVAKKDTNTESSDNKTKGKIRIKMVTYLLTSFGGEVKPSVPCRRFTACKRTLHSMSEMLCLPNFLRSVSHP
jgi:hypothetical protein